MLLTAVLQVGPTESDGMHWSLNKVKFNISTRK